MKIINQVKNEVQSSALPSAPGQGRLNIDRNQQQPTQRAYQPSISTADMGLHVSHHFIYIIVFTCLLTNFF